MLSNAVPQPCPRFSGKHSMAARSPGPDRARLRRAQVAYVSTACATSENKNARRSRLRGLLKTVILKRIQLIPDCKSSLGSLNGAGLPASLVKGWEEPASPRKVRGSHKDAHELSKSTWRAQESGAAHHSSGALQRCGGGGSVFPTGHLSCHLNGIIDSPSPIHLS